jgi:hypothetical protein
MLFKPISLVTTLVICLAALLIAGSAFVRPAHAGHTATTTIATRSCQWHLVPSPTPAAGQSLNEFEAVAAVAKNDIWAVGHSTLQGQRMALVAHWDGSAWHVIPNPTGTQPADLTATSAISAGQVWAVGSISNASFSTSSALIERWNGKSWELVSSPDTTGRGEAFLTGIAGSSASNIWAVGYIITKQGAQTLTEHWDGHAWQVVASPSISHAANNLLSVTVLSPDNAWAAGTYGEVNGPGGVIIEHWDGHTWNLMPVSGLNQSDDVLESIAAVASNNIWAVGRAQQNPLILHWDGTSWQNVAPPNTARGGDLHSVTVTSSHQVWAAGDGYVVGGIRPLIAQWNGHAWNSIQSPASSLPFEGWYGISSVPGNSQLWTVGYAHKDQYATQGQTLAATSC